MVDLDKFGVRGGGWGIRTKSGAAATGGDSDKFSAGGGGGVGCSDRARGACRGARGTRTDARLQGAAVRGGVGLNSY